MITTPNLWRMVRDVACPIQNKDATAMEFNLKCRSRMCSIGIAVIYSHARGSFVYTDLGIDAGPGSTKAIAAVQAIVRVTGPVFERNGSRAIAVRTIEELKDVHPKTDAEQIY